MFQNQYYEFWDYWQLYHKVTFDGPNRLIIINPSETVIDVQTDIYSDWKEWVQYEDNAKYPAALRTTGGDPLNPEGSLRSGRYFFLINGWKLVAPEDINLLDGLEIEGNLFADDGSDIFTTRANEVLIRQVVSNQATIIEFPFTGSVNVTASISADSVISASLVPGQLVTASLVEGSTVSTASYVETVGSVDTVATASYLDSPVQLSPSQSVATASYVSTVDNVQQVVSSSYVQTVESITNPVTIADGQIVTASLADNQIVSASLTGTQETMLMEIYRIFGLDPTRPLVVTPDARSAGAEISQSLVRSGDEVTVTRS